MPLWSLGVNFDQQFGWTGHSFPRDPGMSDLKGINPTILLWGWDV